MFWCCKTHTMPIFDIKHFLAKQAMSAVLIQVSNVVVALAASILLARLLGAEGLGVYAFCMGIIQVLVIPASLGLQQLFVREIATDLAEENWGRIRGLLWRGNQGVFVCSMTLSSVLVMWALLSEAGSVYRGGLFGAAVLLPFFAMGKVNSAALRGLGSLKFSQLSEMTLRPLLFLILMFICMFAGEPFGSSSAVALQAISGVIVCLIVFVVLINKIPSSVKLAKPVYEEKIWFKVSFFFFLLSGLSALNSRLPVLFLGALDLNNETGFFQVAYRSSEVIAFGLIAVSYIVAPELAKLYSQNEKLKLAELILNSSKYMNFYAVLSGVCFLVFAEKIILLVFGLGFGDAVLPFRILCVAQMLNSLFGYSGLILNMIGSEVLTIWCILAGFMFNVLLSILLIPDFGSVGAALASACGLVLWKGLTIIILYKKFNICCGPFLIWR